MNKLFAGFCIFLVGCTPYWGKADKLDNIGEDRTEMLADYNAQVNSLKPKAQQQQEEKDLFEVKQEVDVRSMEWFRQLVDEAQTNSNNVSLEDLYLTSLVNSKQIKVFADIPIIRKTGIQEAEGRFNTRVFADGGYNRVNEAVGNVLRTGVNDRFIEDETFIEFGLRKIFITGGEAVLTQKLSRLQNNSEFFDPNPQSLANLTLRFTQPILKGAGVTYNESAIVLAQLDTQIAENEFKRQLEAHFLEISAAYWDLYLAKINFFMRKKIIDNIKAINTEMTERSDIDALRSQIYHTEAAIAFHRTQLIRAEVAVRNAQDRLMSLVNSPKFHEYKINELTPLDHPITDWVKADLGESAKLALKNRPELEQAFLQLHSAKVRLNMTKNELLPILDVFAEVGLSGIADEVDFPRAFDDEFTGGEPGFSVGFHFEFPIANDTAKARKLRREIEKRQLRHQFESSVESILLEIKVAVREVKAAYQEFLSSQKAYIAAKNEVESLQSRFKFEALLGENNGVSAFLQVILQAQNVYADSQLALVKNLVNYNLAITRLKKAEGTFLSYKNVEVNEVTDENNLPMLRARVKEMQEATPEDWKK